MSNKQVEIFSSSIHGSLSDFEKYLQAFVKAGLRSKAKELFTVELLKILRASGGFVRREDIVGNEMVALGRKIFGNNKTDSIVRECVNKSIGEIYPERSKAV